MHSFTVPAREQVSPGNQAIFDKFEKAYGFVPNLLAMFTYSETAVNDYIGFLGRKSSLSPKEKEAINLAVSQANGCKYCLRGHTVAARAVGFSNEQIMEIRRGNVTFNTQLHALVQLAQAIILHRGRPQQPVIDRFFEAGYTEAGLVDVILAAAGKSISNYLHNITQVPIDWPETAEI
jgi:AhpD family alkylhydroperoxidase